MMYLKFIKHPVIPADPREAFIIPYTPRNLHRGPRKLNGLSVLKTAVTCGHALLVFNIHGGGGAGEGLGEEGREEGVSSARTLPEICCKVLGCLRRLAGWILH